jgi:hypothetical protein
MHVQKSLIVNVLVAQLRAAQTPGAAASDDELLRQAQEDLAKLESEDQQAILEALLSQAATLGYNTGATPAAGSSTALTAPSSSSFPVPLPREAVSRAVPNGGQQTVEQLQAAMAQRQQEVLTKSQKLVESYNKSAAEKGERADKQRYQALMGRKAMAAETNPALRGSPLKEDEQKELERLQYQLEQKHQAESAAAEKESAEKSKSSSKGNKSPASGPKGLTAAIVYFPDGDASAGKYSDNIFAPVLDPTAPGSLATALQTILIRDHNIKQDVYNVDNITAYVTSPSMSPTVIYRGPGGNFAQESLCNALLAVNASSRIYICLTSDSARTMALLKKDNKAKGSPRKVHVTVKSRATSSTMGRPRLKEGSSRPVRCYKCRRNNESGHHCREVLHHIFPVDPPDGQGSKQTSGSVSAWRVGEPCEVFWDDDKEWYTAQVTSVAQSSLAVQFVCDDGQFSDDDPFTILKSDFVTKIREGTLCLFSCVPVLSLSVSLPSVCLSTVSSLFHVCSSV